MGNRLSLGLSQGANLPGISPIQSGSITYDHDDRLSTETYDANGNTLTTGGKTFAYDFENRLKSLNNGAVTIQYDADGNRVAKTVAGVTTRYLVDDLNPTGYAQVVEEVTGTTASRTYTYSLQRISQNQQISSAWTPSFYGYDGGGTVRLLTDSTGTVTDTYDYDAWGNEVNTTGSTPNVYLYRGEQFDTDLSLCYLRARFYNPLTGRLLARDPAEGATTDPSTLHKYLYATANPVNRTDPTGLDSILAPTPSHPKAGLMMYDLFAEYVVFTGGDPGQAQIALFRGPDEWGADPTCKDGLGNARRDISTEEKEKCCKDAPPLSPNAPDPYGPNDRYMGVLARCMFENGGSGAWGNLVRGCLACMHDHQNGYSFKETNTAHWYCYWRSAQRSGVLAGAGGLGKAILMAAKCLGGERPPIIFSPMPFPAF